MDEAAAGCGHCLGPAVQAQAGGSGQSSNNNQTAIITVIRACPGPLHGGATLLGLHMELQGVGDSNNSNEWFAYPEQCDCMKRGGASREQGGVLFTVQTGDDDAPWKTGGLGFG